MTVGFNSTFDAGVLFIYADDERWAKLCFEYAPTDRPMVVSVVTRGKSDDCNSVYIDDNSVYLRLYREGDRLAFHYSEDGEYWHMVRHFTIGDLQDVRIGFSAQAPTGEGCQVEFSEIGYRAGSCRIFAMVSDQESTAKANVPHREPADSSSYYFGRNRFLDIVQMTVTYLVTLFFIR